MLACSNQVKLYLRQRISGTLNFVHTRRRDSIFCIKWRQDLVIFGQEKNKVVCRLDFWIFLKHQNDSKFEVTAYGKYMHQLIEVFSENLGTTFSLFLHCLYHIQHQSHQTCHVECNSTSYSIRCCTAKERKYMYDQFNFHFRFVYTL